MILEAQQIYESLCDAEWDMPITHAELKKPGKSPSLRVVISDDGKRVETIYILSSDETLKHWNQANGKQNGFPIFKIGGPLSEKMDKQEFDTWVKEKSKEKRHTIQNCWLTERFPVSVNLGIKDSFKTRLNQRRSSLVNISETPANRFLDLLSIFSTIDSNTYDRLVYDIIAHLRQEVQNQNLQAANLLIPLLFTDGEKSKVTIIWDLKANHLNGSSASSPANFIYINKALLNNTSIQPTEDDSNGTCAITGKGRLIESTFPEVSLPQIGPSILYSRFKPIESFHRYGTHGAGAFPLSHDHAEKLAAAISALTVPQREGKTWTNVIGEKWKKGKKKSIPSNDLLVVYQASLIDQEFASALGTDQHQLGEAGFEEICRRLTERTKGKTTDQLRGRLFIAVLRAVDKANRKVIFHKTLNVESLEKSARLWQDACKAFPCLKLHIPTEKGKPALFMAPPVLSPGSLPALTKTFHFLDGRTSDSPGGITFPDAMQLLLTMQTPDSKLVKRCLTTSVKRLGSLLQQAASIKYRSSSDLLTMNGDQKWNILKAQSLFSILITSSNRTPNTVMNSIAYQLGQLCAAYDLIHAGYCHQERGGDLPPKLLGNICFQSANRNPTAALSQLSQRAAPHLAWVNRARRTELKDKLTEGEWAVIHARTAARDIRSNSENIHQALLKNEAPLDDLFRAELLLGYLAGFQKRENPESENQISTNA